MSHSPLVYLRLLYRLPALALLSLALLGFARLTGRRRMAWRTWATLHSRICGRRLEITGAARDPSALLIVANHTCYLDAIPVSYLWPQARPVAMHRVRSWFLVGPLASRIGIFVEDGIRESRQRAREELRRVWDSGEAVVLFPEGNASHGGHSSLSDSKTPPPRGEGRSMGPSPFRPGAFREASERGITVQGIRIGYPAELLEALDGRRFEDRFFWVLCQNFTIRAFVFPAERAGSDPEALRRRWEERLLGDSKSEPD